MPESRDVEPTASQFTSDIIADTPIVAIAVSATVLMALMPAHLSHTVKLFLFILLILSIIRFMKSFKVINSMVENLNLFSQ